MSHVSTYEYLEEVYLFRLQIKRLIIDTMNKPELIPRSKVTSKPKLLRRNRIEKDYIHIVLKLYTRFPQDMSNMHNQYMEHAMHGEQ